MFKPGDKVIRFRNHHSDGWRKLRLDKNHICIIKSIQGNIVKFVNVPDNTDGVWSVNNFKLLVVNKEFKYKKQGGNI